MNRIHSILCIAILSLVIGGCSRNPVTGKRQMLFMSEKQEIALGQQSDPSITAAYGKYEDPKLQAFINEKGLEMAKISHRPNLNYEFKILDSPVVNAFAVPGGYVYFTRGIMAHFNNEAEFAGVLGHEIGHITARHSAIQQRNQLLGQIAFIGGVVVSEDFRRYAQQAQQGLGLIFKKFSRDHETQSDELGVEYSSAIGYDAVEMADFYMTLQRLTEKNGASIPTFLSTHPNPANRFQKVKHQASELQKEKPGQYLVNRNEYLQRIDGIIYGDDPKQGYFENNKFYHPELKFVFDVPQWWQKKNTPSNVQMAPKDGGALLTFSLANAQNAEQAANEFISKNKIQLLDSSRESMNGLRGYTIIGEQSNQNPQTGQSTALTILAYFVEYDSKIYYFTGVSNKANFGTHKSTFRNVMKSFAPLRDAKYLNRKPNIVRVQPVRNKSTLSVALRSYNMPSAMLEELAILNGMELTDVVTSGTLIKTIVQSDGSTARNNNTESDVEDVPARANNPQNNGNSQNSGNVLKPKTTTNSTDNNTDSGKGKKVIKLKKID